MVLLFSFSFGMAAMASSFVPPPPCPRSPPVCPDLSGRRREIVKIQLLEREITLLQGELKLIQGVHLPASTSCKEVVELVGAKSDPFVPTKKRRSNGWGIWKWICKSGCLMLSWMGCCSGCGSGCMKMACGWCGCCRIPSCSACSFPCSCRRIPCPECSIPPILKCSSCKPSCCSSCGGISGCSCFSSSSCCPKCIRPSPLLCSSNSTTCTCTCTCTNPLNFNSSCCCCLRGLSL